MEGVRNRFYLLNQFDASSPLHLDVRAMLQQQLGDRLLPFVLRRSSAVSEALAEGMTVIDYAPGSAVAEDYWDLAGWLRSFAAPAAVARWAALERAIRRRCPPNLSLPAATVTIDEGTRRIELARHEGNSLKNPPA